MNCMHYETYRARNWFGHTVKLHLQCTVWNSLSNKFPWTHAGETVWALQSHRPRDDSCSPLVKFLSNMLLCVQINKLQHQDLQRNQLKSIKYCLLLSVVALVGITLENYIDSLSMTAYSTKGHGGAGVCPDNTKWHGIPQTSCQCLTGQDVA